MTKINVIDVAAYILRKQGTIPAMKLQKLVYYSQAWSLVWDDTPLFTNRIEAWAHGPVSPELYDTHRGEYSVSPENFIKNNNVKELSGLQKETVDVVLDAYGDKSAQWLSDQTHSERPWIKARKGLPDSARCNIEITRASIAEYYSSI